MPQFFATCATHLEYLLVDELKELGAANVKEGLSVVYFDAEWQVVYNVLYFSRVASRILYPIAQFEAKDEKMLYDQASIIDWSQHLDTNATFVVNSQSFRSELSHTQFISQRIKDAVVDHFIDANDARPDVEFEYPDLVIQCRIRQNQVTLSIDLAGIGLHHRGYRVEGGVAPIKENLAAALLIRAGWQKLCRQSGSDDLVLYDPMCGSGTFLIEAAMMALDMAPGKFRNYLGIFGWKQFKIGLWNNTLEVAKLKNENSLNAGRLKVIGSDINPQAIKHAQSNCAIGELTEVIKLHATAIDQVKTLALPDSGLVVVNPPYAERLGELDEVKRLYFDLGQLLKQQFIGWKASILSADKVFGHSLGIRANKIYQFNNASIACELLNFDLQKEHFIQRISEHSVDCDFKDKLSDSAIQLCNRIEKNRKGLKKYLSKNNISCYRVYDADLPEYNAAVDVYQDKLHLQEYRPPKSIDEKTARRRIKDIETVAAGIFQIPRKNIFVKQRRQQKGDWQYQTQSRDEKGVVVEKTFYQVSEAGRAFKINLQDYLDTGLFIDHRLTRQTIADLCQGKSLLNLFCYTGSVSVYAATQKSKQTTNIDLSNTYLDWAKDNFKLNHLDLNHHQFIRADVILWLQEASFSETKYDVIFLDPPTFSNSKKMQQHFDLQRDHVALLQASLALLAPHGTLIFSNNFKQFEMEFVDSELFKLQDISKQTTGQDFKRKPLHRCWRIDNLSAG